jgi:hypothetical protein
LRLCLFKEVRGVKGCRGIDDFGGGWCFNLTNLIGFYRVLTSKLDKSLITWTFFSLENWTIEESWGSFLIITFILLILLISRLLSSKSILLALLTGSLLTIIGFIALALGI